MTIQNELDDMLNAFGPEKPEGEEEEKAVEIPEPEPSKEEQGLGATDEGNFKPKEEPTPEVKEEEVVEEKEEVESPEPPPDKDAELLELRAKIAELEASQRKPKEEPKKEEPVKELDFLTSDVDIDELYRDPKELNKLLNKVYQQASNDVKKGTDPSQFIEVINTYNTMKETVENFYTENEDLKPFKKVVSAVFEDVAANNADKPYQEVMASVAAETRKRLGLPLEAKLTEKPKETPKPPRLPSAKKSAEPKESPAPDPLQSEIEAMNKVLLGR